MTKFVREQLNQIQELNEDVFFTYLDFPSSKFIKRLIDKKFKYVWVVGHFIRDQRYDSEIKESPWFDLTLPLTQSNLSRKVKVRSMDVKLDFVVSTDEFLELLKNEEFIQTAGIRCIQMNKLPPSYFVFEKFQEKGLLKQLKKIDMNFFVDFPGNDYGRLYCSRKDWLEALLADDSIDWDYLP